ncbi:MATE family efflux transporter [Formosa sp. 3Alg 14/1]
MMRTFEVLLISIFLSRFFVDKNELGELLQVIFIASILVTFVSGLPLSLNYFYGKYGESRQKDLLFGKFSILLISVSLVLCVVIYASKLFISESFKNEVFTRYISIILLYYFFKLVNTIFPNYHYLKNKLDKYLMLYTVTVISLLGCFLFDFLYGNFNAQLVLLQLLCIEFFRLIINTLIINKKELNFNSQSFKKSEFIYISTISLGVILGAFSLYVDKYLIAILLNPTDFVYYQNGAINLPFVNIITSSLFIALIPMFADLHVKNRIEELAKEVKKAILKCSFFLIPILVYCFFEAVPLIKFLYGDDFEISGHVFKIYILRYMLSVMAFSVFMGSIGLEKKSNFIIFLSAVIGLSLNLVLIPAYGIKGAAWATVFASLITISISLYFIKKRLNLKVSDYFPIKNYFIIILLSILSYVPFYFLNMHFSLKWVVVVSSVVYYMLTLVLLNKKFDLFKVKKLLFKN